MVKEGWGWCSLNSSYLHDLNLAHTVMACQQGLQVCVGAVVMATGHAVCRFVQIVDLLIITLMILTCIKKATLRVSSSLSLSLSLLLRLFSSVSSVLLCLQLDLDRCKAVQSLGSFVAVFCFGYMYIYTLKEKPQRCLLMSPPVQNLRAVIWFHFCLSCFSAQSCCSFCPALSCHILLIFQNILQCLLLEIRLFCVLLAELVGGMCSMLPTHITGICHYAYLRLFF